MIPKKPDDPPRPPAKLLHEPLVDGLDPVKPYQLSMNDRLFLKLQRIRVDE